MQPNHTPLVMDMFRLNTSMCNKCFVLRYRGKQPYNLTQCGHIFCQGCWQEADEKCTLCGNHEVVTMKLNEQLPPKVRSLFEPLDETIKTFSLNMMRVDEFRNKQLKIIMQRFMQLEKKYDALKNRYWDMLQEMKKLKRKWMDLKFEKDKLDKKLMFIQAQRNPLRRVSNTMQTPMNSNVFNHPCSSGYSSESIGLRYDGIRSVGITPVQSVDLRKQHQIVNGFRVPTKRKDMTSMSSCDTTNLKLRNLFMT